MGRGLEVEAAGGARAFMRPVAMLVVGAIAGIAMWVLLMADDGRGPISWQTGERDGLLSAVLARLSTVQH